MDKGLQNQQESVFVPAYEAPKYRGHQGGAGAYFDQSYINCYPEIYKDPVQRAAPAIHVVKRAGSLRADTGSLVATINAAGSASTNMACLCNMTVTQLYDVYIAAFFDSSNTNIKIIQYRPIAGTATVIGTIASPCTINDLVFITEITDGSTLLPGIAVSYQTANKSSGTGFYSISLAGVFTAAASPQGLNTISSGSFPSNLGTPRIITGPFQHMNGHTYIMTIDGFIYESQLTATFPDITSWNTNATVTATQYPDRGIGVYRYKHLLIAAGQDSMEFWSPDNNNPPQSSLVRTDQAFIKFGAATPKTIINIDDVLYWIAYGSADTIGVWKLDGYTPTPITGIREDTGITGSINTIGYPSLLSLETLMIDAKKHLLINGASTFTLAYPTDLSTASAADTYPILSVRDGLSNVLCYSISDQVWWGLACSFSVDAYLIPTTAFPAGSAIGQYKQYFFRRPAALPGGNAVSSTVPFSWNLGGSEGSFYDDNPSHTTTTAAIPVSMNFNTIYNGTTKRKALRRLSLVADTITRGGADASTLAIYFLYNKSGNYAVTTDTNVRRLVLPTQVTGNTSSRVSIANLGMYRTLSLGIMLKTKDPFRMEGVELEIAGGTH